MTQQDTAIVRYLARQCCDHHKKAAFGSLDCVRCNTYAERLEEAVNYGRSGAIPFDLATKLISGT